MRVRTRLGRPSARARFAMSKIKDPKAKKAASLSRDRRNAYGENSKSSRKAIPRGKARSERAHRHAVHQALVSAPRLTSDAGLEHVETELAEAARELQLHGFRKVPDMPLGELLAEKNKRRQR